MSLLPQGDGQRRPTPATWRRFFWLCVMAGVALSLWPEPAHKQAWFTHADKVQHAVAFAILVGLGQLARYRSKGLLFVGLLMLGIAIEVLQSFTSTRMAEWADIGADTAGVLFGFALCGAMDRCSTREPEEHGR